MRQQVQLTNRVYVIIAPAMIDPFAGDASAIHERLPIPNEWPNTKAGVERRNEGERTADFADSLASQQEDDIEKGKNRDDDFQHKRARLMNSSTMKLCSSPTVRSFSSTRLRYSGNPMRLVASRYTRA